MSEELVWVEHPDMPDNDPVHTTKHRFMKIMKHKGWRIMDVDPEAARAAMQGERLTRAQAMKKTAKKKTAKKKAE